jgi:predicted nucleotidyltransferase
LRKGVTYLVKDELRFFYWGEVGYMLDIKRTISNAIEYCYVYSKKEKTLAEIAESLKSQDCMLHSRFRYSIAIDIAKYVIGCYGYAIKDIKLYGSTMEFNAGKYSDIDLIIHVETMGEEIQKDMKILDHLITQEYYLLIGEKTDQNVYMIDIHIIDESLYTHNSSKAYLIHILNTSSVQI